MTKTVTEDMTDADRILEQVLKLDPQERAAFLDNVCRGKPALREKIDDLLLHAGTPYPLLNRLTSRQHPFQQIVPFNNKMDNTCPACQKPWLTGTPCQHCGYGTDRSPLQSGAMLEGGKYTIEHVLGKPGGFGITYLARHGTLKGFHAIKEYLPDDVAIRKDGLVQPIESRQELFDLGQKEFYREAVNLQALSKPEPHPNVLSVLDVFEENGTAYIVMPYYEGQILSEYLDDRQMKKSEALDLMIRVLDGLTHVHEKNAIHLDIKPSNIYLQYEGSLDSIKDANPVLIDFGAARFKVDQQSRYVYGTPSQRNQPVFTDGYAPPEQRALLSEYDVDKYSDTYACAATLYRMVTGQIPAGPYQQGQQWPGEISLGLGKVLAKGLAENPRDRYQDAQALQEALKALQKKPVWPWVVVLLVLFAGLAVFPWETLPQFLEIWQPQPETLASEPAPDSTDQITSLDSTEEIKDPPETTTTTPAIRDGGPPPALPGDLAESLRNARAFYDIELWQPAAENFNEVAQYIDTIDTTRVKRTIRSKLAAAQSWLFHKKYEEAARQFSIAFETLYPN